MILSATFVAVPALSLVDPVKISGPTARWIERFPSSSPRVAGLQVSKMVFAPNDFARPSAPRTKGVRPLRSEEHTSELQSQSNLVCRLLLEKKKKFT